MRADEFVALVQAAAPPRSELLAAGLSEDEADGVLRVFALPSRGGTRREALPDELQRLLVLFDCASFELSTFTFCSPPRLHPRGSLIGHLEADPLVAAPEGPIVLIDHAASGSGAESLCASTPDRFLDALGHRVRVGFGPAVRDAKLASECSRRAGVTYPGVFWRAVAE